MRRIAVMAVAVSLGGCATVPCVPAIVSKTVEVPVSRACVPTNLDAAPSYPDTAEALKAAPDAAVRYQLMFAGRLLRESRLMALEPVIQDCRK